MPEYTHDEQVQLGRIFPGGLFAKLLGTIVEKVAATFESRLKRIEERLEELEAHDDYVDRAEAKEFAEDRAFDPSSVDAPAVVPVMDPSGVVTPAPPTPAEPVAEPETQSEPETASAVDEKEEKAEADFASLLAQATSKGKKAEVEAANEAEAFSKAKAAIKAELRKRDLGPIDCDARTTCGDREVTAWSFLVNSVVDGSMTVEAAIDLAVAEGWPIETDELAVSRETWTSLAEALTEAGRFLHKETEINGKIVKPMLYFGMAIDKGKLTLDQVIDLVKTAGAAWSSPIRSRDEDHGFTSSAARDAHSGQPGAGNKSKAAARHNGGAKEPPFERGRKKK